MKVTISFFWAAIAFSIVASAGQQDFNSPEQLAKRCVRENSGDAALYSNDFKWGYPLAEMIQRFSEIYKSPKRLPRRAYFDPVEKTLKLPYDSSRGGDVTLPANFVKSVRRHVEEALRLEYIDGVFFPDMGHSHFLVPLKKWEKLSKIPVERMNELYLAMFKEPDLKVVYHTAEQLQTRDENKKLIEDRRVQWRFFSRNLVGDNRGEGRLELLQNPTHQMNTLGDVEGFYWWGGGFNISANEKGCIAYDDKGTVKFFDLSLFDLEQDPSIPRDGFD
jgi:hypothetical protein